MRVISWFINQRSTRKLGGPISCTISQSISVWGVYIRTVTPCRGFGISHRSSMDRKSLVGVVALGNPSPQKRSKTLSSMDWSKGKNYRKAP